MKALTTFSILMILSLVALGQKHTISGYISDAQTGEKLIGASIYDKKSKSGTTSNTYGFYSLTLPADSINLFISYVGYQTVNKKIKLDRDVTQNIEFTSVLSLDEVTITAGNLERIEEQTNMSIVHMPVQEIKKLPALLGEVDVLKSMQLLPGVQSGTEGSSGIYVRGGGPDQNLILLDGTPVYNASHLFGFFSVFNADAIHHVELVKGGFPARYGGRLSSVIDIRMKEGNMKEIKGEGAIGLLSSKLTVEGPIIKDKTSFIISGRRTYFDLFMRPLMNLAGEGAENTGYFFYDLNAKVNHKFSDKDRLYVSYYMGDDAFYSKIKPYSYLYDEILYEERAESRIGWGNITSSLRWNHQFNQKLFSNLTLTFSDYRMEVSDYMESIQSGDSVYTQINSSKYLSGIQDVAGNVDFDYLPSPNHFIRFGGKWIYHTFSPGATSYKIENTGTTDIDSTIGEKNVYANEFALYAEDDMKLFSRLKANLGVHLSGFYVNGKMYYSAQPRLSMRYLLPNSWAIKASYASMQQYIHLLTNSTIGLPTDLWVPATDEVEPQTSHQVALGIAATLGEQFEFTLEGYYKTMHNILEYKDGATFMSSSKEWTDKIETGRGWAYGLEAFLQKKYGQFTGWIGYTLSWSDRQFENLNFGEVFPYKYDRRHDISIVGSFELNEKWDISAAWVYGTGNALTLPITRYRAASMGGTQDENGYYYYQDLEYFEKRNDFRAAAYHRLDFSAKRKIYYPWGEMAWDLGAYNLYSRRNPFYYYFGYDKRGYRALRRVSIFPIIPTIALSVKF
ncbi:MAG: TonB-dependent receptor [Marinilabiliales bacterium]|nr:MAG: TonB-dependent receptor [Marinilabiliales bacterium]